MKIAVIGSGLMGQNHIRVLKNIPAVDEVVISDINRENLDAVVKRFGVEKSFTDYRELLEKERPDGVIVATHPADHKQTALDVIDVGIPLLVEKPIAATVEEAETMIAAAETKGVHLTVGHIERFNPVIAKIKEFIDNRLLTNIYLVNTHRVGPFPKRLLGKTEGVLIDLAVHDFDIIAYLVGDIQSIQSQKIKSGDQEIYVKALLGLESNITASCEFSWISPRRLRSIEIYGDEGMIYGDYYEQEVWFYENDDFDTESGSLGTFFRNGMVKSGKVIKYPMYKQEPLLLELTDFIGVVGGTGTPLVKPAQALAALENALKI